MTNFFDKVSDWPSGFEVVRIALDYPSAFELSSLRNQCSKAYEAGDLNDRLLPQDHGRHLEKQRKLCSHNALLL